MGFLGVNTKRRSPFPKRPTKQPKRDPLAVRTPTPEIETLQSIVPQKKVHPIETLSGDVLGMILIYSGNLALPQVSLILAHKLRRTRYLEMSLLRSQVDPVNHSIPIFPAFKWPFVTPQLLEQLDVRAFTSENGLPYVPTSLESNLDSPENVDTISFMVCRGCRVEDSRRVYKALARQQHWRAVEKMAAENHRADTEVVVLALEANQGAELAIELLRLTSEVKNDWEQIWAVQQAAQKACVPEVSSYLITG